MSYASSDASVARALQQRLTEAGVQVWSADSIPAGERWGPAIQRALNTADDVVVLLSEAALASPSLFVEVGAAVAATESEPGRRIIPVALDGSTPSGLLARYQWIRAARMSPSQVANAVIRALETPVSRESGTAARADELRELRSIEAALTAMREQENRFEIRRARLVAWSWTAVLTLSVAATAIALFSGAAVAEAALTSILSASVGLLGLVAGFYFGRASDGRGDE